MLILNLDQEEWVKGNYTATTGNGVSFTIYTEPKMANVKNLTGYTLEMLAYDQDGVRLYLYDCDIVVAASGTGEFLPISGEFNNDFIGEVEIRLTKSGEVLSARGLNGSAKLRIR
jgi:predicted deacetylase